MQSAQQNVQKSSNTILPFSISSVSGSLTLIHGSPGVKGGALTLLLNTGNSSYDAWHQDCWNIDFSGIRDDFQENVAHRNARETTKQHCQDGFNGIELQVRR